MADFAQSELQRRMENLIRVGTIEEVDYSGHTPKFRVKMGEILSGWIPMGKRRAGKDVEYWAFDKGEQVMVLSPGGDFAQAVILMAINQAEIPAPVQTGDVHMLKYHNGDYIEHDNSDGRNKHFYANELEVKAEGASRNKYTDKSQIVCDDILLIKSKKKLVLKGPSGSITL